MSLKSFIILTIFLTCGWCKLSSDLTVCKFGDDACVTAAASQFIKQNPKGRSEIGLPPLDPFKITSLTISQPSGRPVALEMKLTNVDVKGLSNIKFEKLTGFKRDIDKFEIYGLVPHLNIKGKYKINGRIFVLPIQGNGDFSIAIDALKIGIKMRPTIEEIDEGRQHLGVDKLKLRLEPANVKVHFTNLFNGNEALAQNMNNFLNENWRAVWQEMYEPINQAISNIVEGILGKMFQYHAYEDFFLD